MLMFPHWATHAALLGGVLLTTVPAIAPAALAQAEPSTTAPTATIQIQRAEQFVDLAFSHQYQAALQYLHPVLQAELQRTLAQRIQDYELVTGPFQERQETQVEDNVVLVTTEFANVTDNIVVIFDENGFITGVDFPIHPARSL